MASAKSLEDMLSSEVDESAVSALVGSLESQLASPTTLTDAQHSSPIVNNHVVNNTASLTSQQQPPPNSEGGSSNSNSNANNNPSLVSRLHDGPKQQQQPQPQHQQQLLNSDVVNVATTPKTVLGVNSVASTAVTPTNTITVTLAGAVPACGYINQVTSATTQQALITSAASIAAAARGPGAPEIKIVYPPQTTSVANFSALGINSGGVIRTTQGVPNGNASASKAQLQQQQQQQHANNNAMQTLSNVAAAQQSIIVPGGNGAKVGLGVAAGVGRLTVREQLEKQKQQESLVPKPHIVIKPDGMMVNVKQDGTTSEATVVQQSMGMVKGGGGQPTVIAVSKHGQMQGTGQPVNVMTQMVSNPNILQGVQIVNVNAMRPGTPGTQGQKTLAPRVVISNPVRIAAASTQVLGARPGTPGPQVPNTFTLQSGNLVRGTLLVKTENGQFQLVNVGTTLQGSNASNMPGTYRFQSVTHAGAQAPVRSIAPQQVTVTLPVSQANQQVKVQHVRTLNKIHPPNVGTPPHTMVQNMLQASQPAVSIVTTAPGAGTTSVATVPTLVHQVTSSSASVPTNPLNIQTLHPSLTSATSIVTAPTQQNSAASQMSPDTAKKKCKNFLSTLLRLASDQPENVATNVRNLIQGLIDGNVQPEDFTNQLQRELNSSPQPCLVPFLKKSLPYLRHSLATRELTIEGVRPPPPNVVVTLPAIPSSIPQIQITQSRPSIPAQSTQVRLMAPGPQGTIQLTQPGLQGLLPHPRLFTPSPRLQHTTPMTQGKSLLAGSTIRPMIGGAAIMSPATVGALQRVQTLRTPVPQTPAALKEKEKRSYSSTLRDDDDINDVAAMGGVNLIEESQRILAANAEFVGTQIRSCKDENFLFTGPLQQRIKSIVARMGLDEPSSDVAALISHATQERLKTLVEKLGVIAEHRLDLVKTDPRYEVTQDVKGQLKFLEELDRLEKKRHEEQEREILMRAAKSRSKVEDPEQLKLKQKAKEMQRAEMEEMRQREANMTALLAIGPRKKLKVEPPGSASSSQSNTTGSFSTSGSFPSSTSRPQMRQRVKRVNLRDLIFLLEQEKDTCRSVMLYKSYLK